MAEEIIDDSGIDSGSNYDKTFQCSDTEDDITKTSGKQTLCLRTYFRGSIMFVRKFTKTLLT